MYSKDPREALREYAEAYVEGTPERRLISDLVRATEERYPGGRHMGWSRLRIMHELLPQARHSVDPVDGVRPDADVHERRPELRRPDGAT